MARKQFDLIVFDWDGTLMDSTTAIVKCIQAAAKDLNLPIPSDSAASHVIGLGLAEAMQVALPDIDPKYYPRMVERYRHHFLSEHHELTLFKGVEEMLQELSQEGYFLAVATGKSRVGLNRALNAVKLLSLFDATRCADETFSKPHPAMLQELTRELGQDMRRTVMIGDTTHDLLMANNAGAAAIAVQYGAHPVAQLDACQPLFSAATVAELHGWLERARLMVAFTGPVAQLPVCAADQVAEGGKGVRFPVLAGGYKGTGFVVRYHGVVYGYLNRCAHVPIELDWSEGDFFESSGLYLMCSTHGAIYVPESGYCAGGPCKGGRLRVIAVLERDGQIFWSPDDYVQPPAADGAPSPFP